SWAQADPVDFTTTANDELAGVSVTASYGPPYNSGTGSVQSWGPFSPQSWASVHLTVDQPNDFVLNPLKQAASNDAALAAEISAYQAASADQQGKWHDAYATALKDATVTDGKVTVGDGATARCRPSSRAWCCSDRRELWTGCCCPATTSIRRTTPSRCSSSTTVVTWRAWRRASI